MRKLWLFGGVLVVLLLLAVGAAGGIGYAFWHYGRSLPDYKQLADYRPPVMTRVHAADGSLVTEYAKEHRLFVPVTVIPKRVENAFLSAEDKRFYEHGGIDPQGIARAFLTNLYNYFSGRRLVGASTITQQVAKNFLLTSEISLERKFKEAILAFRIERAFTKERILELYLNEIYLGQGSYGVAAAALNYFDKSLDELTVAEAAYLAALPKAPNNYHPVRFAERAKDRRDWVIARMLEDRRIGPEQAEVATAEPLISRPSRDIQFVAGDWFTEEARRELADRFGDDNLYEGGLSVRTSMDPVLQEVGERVLRNGLMAYDMRHGYRGALAKIEVGDDWPERLAEFAMPAGALPGWRPAVVLELGKEAARIGLAAEVTGRIPLADLEWARRQLEDDKLGPEIKRTGDVFAVGDVVLVAEPTDEAAAAAAAADAKTDEAGDEAEKTWSLRQVPEVNGGIVAMDPHTGRVLALVGGWSFAASQFNRATQARRQPGSAFKPFVYAAALDNGFTPVSLILDAPFVGRKPDGTPWKPGNYSRRFYGPSTLRLGVEKSRNVMTVRLAQYVGMGPIVRYAERFGIAENLPYELGMALGAGETTLLRLTAAYSMLVNGGKRIRPTLIDRVQDRRGNTVFRHDQRECPNCLADAWLGQPEPDVPDIREQVLDPITAYQVVSMLEGVVRRGTGWRAKRVGKPLGGKTGTTNESRDAWFMGFSADLAVGVFVGFDEPKSLGAKETGSSAAAPVFTDFMVEALQGRSAPPFRIPRGVRIMRIEATTGKPARPGTQNVILEAFRPGTEPKQTRRPSPVIGTEPPGTIQPGDSRPRRSDGGLY